ncbi:MAG: hypothetical protein MJ177_01650 [Clostridia bacterium]|nr:hypothetical protein [Clostridia bacterium]
MKFNEECFLPVILGGDITAYSLVRSFHEKYNIKSLVVGLYPTKIIAESQLAEERCNDKLEDINVLMETLIGIGKEFKGKKKLIILGCGDWYVRAIVENKEVLSEYFLIPYIDLSLLDEIVKKEKFYAICDTLDIPHPKTLEVDCTTGELPDELGFDFPVIAKTANSARYHYAEFPGKKKVFCIHSRPELEQLMEKLKNSNYNDKFLIQECIPGDDDCMRVLTCYCDRNSKVKFAAAGHVLLEDHMPLAIGNPAVIINEVNEQLVSDATKFLEHVGYTGFANFDAKYDSRDGKFKFFEINVRLGRSNFYVTGSGFSTVERIVDDLVYGKELTYTVADKENLFTVLPMGVIKKYCRNRQLTDKAVQLRKQGNWVHPLLYSKDRHIKRDFYVYAGLLNYYRKYKNNKWLLD